MGFAPIRGAWVGIFLAVLAAWAPTVGGQAYPAKPVRIVLPYLGGTDFIGRWLALKLSASLGQQVIVDPRPGAGGNIGHEIVATAPADGYTLGLMAPPLVINPHLGGKLNYDPMRDYTPIALLATIPSVLVVHPSVPAKTLRELIQLARSRPGKLTYGSGGLGATSHLAGELFASLAKIKIVHVPYKGASFALVGALSGEVDMVTPAASAAVSYVKDNRMRAVAVLDTKRTSSMPEVPTAAEAGLPGFLTVNWYALLAPPGTPRAIVDRLHSESIKVIQSADTKERFATMGAEPALGTPEQTAAYLRAEYERWGKVIRDAGIKGE